MHALRSPTSNTFHSPQWVAAHTMNTYMDADAMVDAVMRARADNGERGSTRLRQKDDGECVKTWTRSADAKKNDVSGIVL